MAPRKKTPAEGGCYIVRFKTEDGKERSAPSGTYLDLKAAANRVVNESIDHPSGPKFLMYAFGFGYYGLKDCISICKQNRTFN